MGLAVAALAQANRGNYTRLVDFIEADLRQRLRSFRASTEKLRQRIQIWLVLLGCVLFGIWLGLGSLVFAVLATSLLAAGPWHLVRRMSQRRKQRVEDQMADAMVSFASGIRAGLSLAQALQLLADEAPRPISQEFQQFVGEYKLGKPIDRTLESAKQRLQSENFVLFAASLLASREAGGRLNETVERIAESVVEMQRLERKIRTETAQARKSAVYMAVVPLVLLVVYYFIDPLSTRLLFVTLPGQMLLTAAIVLNLIAYFWALKILNPDI